jgi:uncharacterized membrane protein YgcG
VSQQSGIAVPLLLALGCIVSVADATPRAANPYLAFLPQGIEPDYSAWQQKLSQQSSVRTAAKAHSLSAYSAPLSVKASGSNTSLANAQPLTGFGTGSDESNQLVIEGALGSASSGVEVTERVVNGADFEDDGSIGLAHVFTDLSVSLSYRITAAIGDGPNGSAGSGSGDFDYFRFDNLNAGDYLDLQIQAYQLDEANELDSYLVVLDQDGNLIAENDDASDIFDSALNVRIPADGAYYVVVMSYDNYPVDIESSDSGEGYWTEGEYELLVSLSADAVQSAAAHYFSTPLRAGDVLEVAGTGAGLDQVSLRSSDDSLLMYSPFNLAFVLPALSPVGVLAGDMSLAYVIPEDGTYELVVGGEGGSRYSLSALVHRPALELADEGTEQIIFVDFNGATLNTVELFDGDIESASLSPLSAFMTDFGLSASDEDALIDGIMAVIKQQLATDPANRSHNANTRVTLKNSRDDADPFGEANVARIVIGGTIDEFGIETIGLSQSIDPGNFVHNETAVVLLDLLSAEPEDLNSLNGYEVQDANGVNARLEFVARVVGSIASHEAGHFLSSFHTDQFNDTVNLMDQGGNLEELMGLDDNGVYIAGTGNLPGFEVDTYVDNEGFVGLEDTLNALAFGLSVSGSTSTDSGSSGSTDSSGSLASNGNGSSGGSLLLLPLVGLLLLRRR